MSANPMLSSRKVTTAPAHGALTSFHMKTLAWSLAAMACCGFAAKNAQAQTTNLADVPLAVLNSVDQNTYLTLDRSGSMTWIMSQDTYNYPLEYNNQKRYRPWLLDGTLTAPKGPIRFEDANPNNFCNGVDDWRDYKGSKTESSIVWVGSFIPGSPSKVRPACTHTGNQFKYAAGENSYTQGVIQNASVPPPPSPRPRGRTDCASPGGCTAAEERQNFANYWQYHRNRNLATRAAIGESFGKLSYRARSGFAYYSDQLPNQVETSGIVLLDGTRDCAGNEVSSFDKSCRYQFFRDHVYSDVRIVGGTPTRVALIGISDIFRDSDAYKEYPGRSVSSRNKIYGCRQNYNILITDGYWNVGCPVGPAIGNADGSAGAPFADSWGGTWGSSNCESSGPTLADIGYYYWNTDLMPSLVNNVPVTTRDPNKFQHIVNYTVAMGLSGTIPKATLNEAFSWLDTMNDNPRPAAPTLNWKNPITHTNEERVDDLAHTAFNSRGMYFEASDPDQLTRALFAALRDTNGRSSSAPAGIANPELRGPDNITYLTAYNASFWTGQLQAYKISSETGEIDFGHPLWSPTPQERVEDKFHNDTGHQNRVVVTWNGVNNTSTIGGKGVPFRPDTTINGKTLKEAFRLLDLSGDGDGEAIINYLRGDKSNEGLDDLNYRERKMLLGDIVMAGPVVVGKAKMKYKEDGVGEDIGYADFVADKANRPPTLFVGANDGMVHAFSAVNPGSDQGGDELWNYIPSFAYDCSLAEAACTAMFTDTEPNNLRDSALAVGFTHKFFVNGSLQDTDVDFSKTGDRGGAPDWRTILTGTLGKGGHGVFALDVTDPRATSEADAAQKVLWEFPYRDSSGKPIEAAKNMGYLMGKIHIAKVRISGKQRWVALVPSGYNNGAGSNGKVIGTGGDGKGRLFVLNAATGELIKEIVTEAGSPDNPSGLGYIAFRSKNHTINHTVDDAVYGGDLLGNLWRFDMSSDDINQWKAERIATLVDKSGVPQPITSAPAIARVNYGILGDRTWILVGTGRYFDVTDRPQAPGNTDEENATAAQQQTFYVLKDPFQKDEDGVPLEGDTTILPLRSQLIAYSLSTAGALGQDRYASLQSTPSDDALGWYVDLGNYERITIEPEIVYTQAVVAVNAPSDDPCVVRGKGSLLSLSLLDYSTGRLTPGLAAGYSFGDSIVSAMTIVQTDTGDYKAIVSVDRPWTKEDCNTLHSNKAGMPCNVAGSSDEAGDNGQIQILDIPPFEPGLTGQARRTYWRDVMVE